MAPRVRRTSRDVSHMRLPNFYLCPADRSKTTPVRWRTFDCKVTYKGEKAKCDANLDVYKGKEPGDLDGRRHGKGACIEFSTHDIMVMAEYSAAWNEVTLRATFDPASMFDPTAYTDVLQEVELGYRPAERETDERLDRYYYPLLRVPIFYVGPGLAAAGVATRAFLGKEVDRMPDITGKYWYTYGAMQVPLLNASTPRQILVDHVGAIAMPQNAISGLVHVVLTIEDFETYGFEAVPFMVPLIKTLGEIAGVGALLALAIFHCQGSPQEHSSSRLVAWTESELDTERFYDRVAVADNPDLEAETGGLLRDSERGRKQNLLQVTEDRDLAE